MHAAFLSYDWHTQELNMGSIPSRPLAQSVETGLGFNQSPTEIYVGPTYRAILPHHHVALELGMCGAYLPFLHTSSWVRCTGSGLFMSLSNAVCWYRFVANYCIQTE
jgi:hypothetical protein